MISLPERLNTKASLEVADARGPVDDQVLA